jgi:hypothetical protein
LAIESDTVATGGGGAPPPQAIEVNAIACATMICRTSREGAVTIRASYCIAACCSIC